MTNAPKPEQDLTHNEHSFDGITFEVVEEEDNPEGQKVKRRGIYLWPNLITRAALSKSFCTSNASRTGEFAQAIYASFLSALSDE